MLKWVNCMGCEHLNELLQSERRRVEGSLRKNIRKWAVVVSVVVFHFEVKLQRYQRYHSNGYVAF